MKPDPSWPAIWTTGELLGAVAIGVLVYFFGPRAGTYAGSPSVFVEDLFPWLFWYVLLIAAGLFIGVVYRRTRTTKPNLKDPAGIRGLLKK